MLNCQNCGADVTPNFARVFGDNQNSVDGCVHCRSSRELTGMDGDDAYLPY